MKIRFQIDKKNEVEKSMPSHPGVFVLSHSKRIMNKIVHEIYAFYSNKVYYQDTESQYINFDLYEKLKETGYVRYFRTSKKRLCRRK